MLERLLGNLPLDEFFERHYLKTPFALPGTAKELIPLARRQTIDALLPRVPSKDILVVRNGKLLADLAPSHAAEAKRLQETGHSLVLRHCDRFDEGLGELARTFERELEGEVAIQLYVTPGGFHSFGWHYDAEEVFIFQTEGTKEYFLRRNTVHPAPVLEAMPKDMEYEKESSPLIAATLLPGDWLYVPGGWWHMAKGLEDSISISLGVTAFTALDWLDALRPRLAERAPFRARDPWRTPEAERAAWSAAVSRELEAVLAEHRGWARDRLIEKIRQKRNSPSRS
jgi:50S ribosomal protein L16 3-hydroxylase